MYDISWWNKLYDISRWNNFRQKRLSVSEPATAVYNCRLYMLLPSISSDISYLEYIPSDHTFSHFYNKINLYIVRPCFQLKKTLLLAFNFIRIKMLWNISSQNMFFFLAQSWVRESFFKNVMFQNSHRYDLATSKKAILISTVVSSSVGCFLIAV